MTINAKTNKRWSNPPAVKDVTIPNAQSTSRSTQIVQSIPISPSRPRVQAQVQSGGHSVHWWNRETDGARCRSCTQGGSCCSWGVAQQVEFKDEARHDPGPLLGLAPAGPAWPDRGNASRTDFRRG